MKKITAILLVLCMLVPCLAAETAPRKASQQEYVNETFAGEIIIPMNDTEKNRAGRKLENLCCRCRI